VNIEMIKQKFAEKGMRNMEREIEILKKLRHQNIIHLEDYFITKRHYYLMFEYCSLGSLHDYLQKEKTLGELQAQKLVY